MRILVDTTVLVDLDRHEKTAVKLCKSLERKNITLLVSTISSSEMMVGPYLQEDFEDRVLKAKEILQRFDPVDVDSAVAEQTAKLVAQEILTGKKKSYQDVVVAASSLAAEVDFLLTDNKKHLDFPQLEGKVYTPKEFLTAWERKELKFV
jgi:predicted nucleic acid-binding protein